MDMLTMLTAPRFTMTDLEVALGLKERSGVARLLVQRLRKLHAGSYDEIASQETDSGIEVAEAAAENGDGPGSVS